MAFNEGGEHFRSGSAMRMAERGGEDKAMENKAEGEGRESEGAKMTLEHDGAGGMHSTDEKGERTDHPTLGLTDIFAATIPTLDFVPAVHVNYAETVLRIRDGLPKLKDFPAEMGGSGEAVPE